MPLTPSFSSAQAAPAVETLFLDEAHHLSEPFLRVEPYREPGLEKAVLTEMTDMRVMTSSPMTGAALMSHPLSTHLPKRRLSQSPTLFIAPSDGAVSTASQHGSALSLSPFTTSLPLFQLFNAVTSCVQRDRRSLSLPLPFSLPTLLHDTPSHSSSLQVRSVLPFPCSPNLQQPRPPSMMQAPTRLLVSPWTPFNVIGFGSSPDAPSQWFPLTPFMTQNDCLALLGESFRLRWFPDVLTNSHPPCLGFKTILLEIAETSVVLRVTPSGKPEVIANGKTWNPNVLSTSSPAEGDESQHVSQSASQTPEPLTLSLGADCQLCLKVTPTWGADGLVWQGLCASIRNHPDVTFQFQAVQVPGTQQNPIFSWSSRIEIQTPYQWSPDIAATALCSTLSRGDEHEDDYSCESFPNLKEQYPYGADSHLPSKLVLPSSSSPSSSSLPRQWHCSPESESDSLTQLLVQKLLAPLSVLSLCQDTMTQWGLNDSASGDM